jgi:hypothetical protein
VFVMRDFLSDFHIREILTFQKLLLVYDSYTGVFVVTFPCMHILYPGLKYCPFIRSCEVFLPCFKNLCRQVFFPCLLMKPSIPFSFFASFFKSKN